MLLLGVGTGYAVVRARDRLITLSAFLYVTTAEAVGLAASATQERWKRAVRDACEIRERRDRRWRISPERGAAARAEGAEVLARTARRITERRGL
jgi:hypothetical protein